MEKEFEMLLMLKALLGDLYLLNTGDHFEQKLQPVQISDIENSVLTRLREKQYFWNEASNIKPAHSNNHHNKCIICPFWVLVGGGWIL